jgi:hypothetical protein
MPRKTVKPRALDFDTDPTVCIGLSLERKLILAFLAPDHSRKSAQTTPLSRTASDCLSPPMFSDMRRSFVGIIDQSFDGIEVSGIKSPDGVVLYHGDPLTGRPIRYDDETINTVPHVYNYHIFYYLQ